MIIQQTNNLALNTPKTYLMNGYATGVGTFALRNTNGFGSSWAIQIGETGQEQSEVLLLSGDPGAGTLGTTTVVSRFEHPADTPVFATKYNQVVFYRSTTGTAGVATALTNGTITYQPDHLFTQFDDTTGSISYAYKTLFRNSVLSTETDLSDWIVITPSFYSLAVIRERTKEKLWNSDFLDDPTIDNWTNEFKDKLTNLAIQSNEDYSLGTVAVAFGTDGLGTITTGDFKQPRRVWVTYNGNDTYQSTSQEANQDWPNRVYNSTHPYHSWARDDVLQIKPSDSGGTATIMFYRMGTTLVNDTDELPRFMRGYTDGFVEYNLLQAQYKDQRITMSDKKGAEQSLMKDFVDQLAPRDKTGPRYVRLTESISADDYNL